MSEDYNDMPEEFEVNRDEINSGAKKRFEQVSEIDRQILQLVDHRASLLRREGQWRRSKHLSHVDPKLEKHLRTSWDEAGEGLGLDARLSRQLFTIANQFAAQPGRSTTTAAIPEGYRLAPTREPAEARIAGPRSSRLTRMWLAMAASCGQGIELDDPLLNAVTKDFAKGLKQIGAALTWDDRNFTIDPTEPLSFENKLAFCGEDRFNFYLMLCLALGGAGRCKFTGQAMLQLLDIAPLNKFLPKLGARLVPMNPNNPGLPARLECGGIMDEDIALPPGTDPDFAAALTLAAWCYPGGLTIKNVDKCMAESVREAISVLHACGIEATFKAGEVTVSDGIPEVPNAPILPLDPAMNAALLAIPAFSGGTITVFGTWGETKGADQCLEDLKACGIELDVQEDRIISRRAAVRPQEPTIALGENAEHYPLALALGLLLRKSTLTGTIPAEAVELLDKMNAEYERSEDDKTLTLLNSELEWEGVWGSPAPAWSVCCALSAWVRPGIALDNHGELTAFWPQFWNFYNTLPTGKMKSKPKKEVKSDDKRRIRVKY